MGWCQDAVHPLLYLAAVMLFFPLGVYYPTHRFLLWLDRRFGQG